jgi:hypothetical protein
MKIAIMQPYFFPYIGYWQLIHAADCFVLFDDAQYMRHGWINRNRILKPGGGWQYFVVPLRKHSLKDSIKNIQVHPEIEWKERILAQLAHYKKKAPYFNETIEIVREILFGISVQNIAGINFSIISKMCKNLDINREIFLSSKKEFDYNNVGDAGEWALRIAEQMGADEYINPTSGAGLFSGDKFSSSNVKLCFLSSHEIVYSQRGVFEPSLSIIDVMMFNGADGAKELLLKYSIEPGSH